MFKIIPTPNGWFAAVYLLPYLVTGIALAYKLRNSDRKHRSQWLALLGLVFSMTAITMSLMKVPW